VLTQEVVYMLINPTIEKLRDMKLKVMAQLLSDSDPALRELSLSVVKFNYPVSGKKIPHLFTNFCL